LGLDLSMDYLLNEIERRQQVLIWMVNRNIRDYRSVNNILTQYYHKPEKLYKKVAESM